MHAGARVAILLALSGAAAGFRLEVDRGSRADQGAPVGERRLSEASCDETFDCNDGPTCCPDYWCVSNTCSDSPVGASCNYDSICNGSGARGGSSSSGVAPSTSSDWSAR